MSTKAPTAEILDQLAQATKERASRNGDATQTTPAVPPAPPAQRTAERAHADQGAAAAAPAAGTANAKYLLLDHHMGSSAGTLWAYANGGWHASATSQPADEQGIAQVAFASNVVEASWNDKGDIWLFRCWKYL